MRALRYASFLTQFAGFGSRVDMRRAVDDAELEVTKRIRHDVSCRETGYLPESMLLDEFDDRAKVYNAYVDGEPAATVRLIDSGTSRLELYDTDPRIERWLGAEKRYLEVGRLAVLKPFRSFRVSAAMTKFVFQQQMAAGADAMVISCTSRLIPYWEKFGFRLVNGEPIQRRGIVAHVDFLMSLDGMRCYRSPSRMTLPFMLAIDLPHGRRSFAARSGAAWLTPRVRRLGASFDLALTKF